MLKIVESDVTRTFIRVSPRFLRIRTLRKFADEKKYAVEAYIEETVSGTKKD